jgi:NDP-sugar pyrophosphorylase family protein
MEASAFGVLHVDKDDKIISFLEKPKDPPPMPGHPDKALASMGIYVFETKFLIEQLKRDAADPDSGHDFGKDIIPYIVKQTKLPLKPGAPVGDLEKSGIPFVKNNPKFKAAVDKALADLQADGSFAKISTKWFDRDVSKPPVAK